MIEMIELGQCCEIVSGSTPSRFEDKYWNGDIDWFTPKDLSKIEGKYLYDSPERITEEGFKSCSTKILPANSLLFTSRAPIGHIAINTKEACTNQGFKSFIPKENVNIDYLYYVIKKFTPQLQDLGNGATFKELSKATVSSFKIPLPPLHQQQKIANILDAADVLRQNDKALVAKYGELTQALFLDMFGDSDKSNEAIELGNVIQLIGGGTPSKDIETYWNGKIPWASVKDLKSEKLDSTTDFISEEGVKNSSTKIIPSGSLIVATRMAVGRAAICQQDTAINQDLKAIKITGKVNVKYLLHLFKSKELYFDSISSGATVKGIKIEHITKLKVSIPSFELQNQFAERVTMIEEQKAIAQRNLEKSEELFNSLLQKAFKGELV